jgi:hypothetical protein
MNCSDRHVPLSHGDLTPRQGLDSLASAGARQQANPLSVRLLE